MKPLSIAVAALAAAALAVYFKSGDPSAALLTVFALACAYTTFRSSTISAFLRILVAIFSTETVLFGALSLLGSLDLWPKAYEEYQLPDSLALTVAMFSMLTWAGSHFRVVGAITRICDHFFASNAPTRARVWPLPSFASTDRRVAAAMIVALVLLNQVEVAISVRLSFVGRDFFTALQAKEAATFWRILLTVLPVWIAVLIVANLIEIFIQGMLTVRWRRRLTHHYLGEWLADSTHYRISLSGDGTDNPDQRISDDINRFIDGGGVAGGNLGGYGIYSYTIQLIATLSQLVSFAIILWGLSAQFTVPGTTVAIPGFLLWVAIVYAATGTLLAHLLGRVLARLHFQRQHYEADFRFSLARIREYSEQVALLKGEPTEMRAGMGRFTRIYDNFVDITHVRMRLNSFLIFYQQIGGYIPFIVAAPFYFIGKIQYGVLNQTAQAFGTVDESLKFFVTYYGSLAEFKAVLDRLTSFEASIDAARAREANPAIARRDSAENAISAEHLRLGLPDGRVIVADSTFQIPARVPTLFSGPSGSGKSTLFRAIAGMWPSGAGAVSVPKGARVMLLPQKPYIPIGSLRAAVAYPADETAFSDDALRGALEAARLPALAARLDEEDNWSMRLSGGEQQRLAVARALLAKPDWLFLDEATAALDEDGEAALYKAFAERMPDATIVSIGHRSTLNAFHQRRIVMTPDASGTFAAKSAETVG